MAKFNVIETRYRFAHFGGWFIEVFYLTDKSTRLVWSQKDLQDRPEAHLEALKYFAEANKLIGRCAFAYRKEWRRNLHLFQAGDGNVDPWIFFIDRGPDGIVEVPLVIPEKKAWGEPEDIFGEDE